MNRLVIVPNPQLEAAGLALKTNLPVLTNEIDANNLLQLMGPLAHRTLSRTAGEANDAELLLWAREGNEHAVAWTSATGGDKIEGRARASADEGLIARVSESHRSASASGPDLQASEWTNLDRLRGASVESMAASPLIVFESCVGVLSRVRYIGSGAAEISPPAEAAAVLSRFIEDRLIRLSLGLEST